MKPDIKKMNKSSGYPKKLSSKIKIFATVFVLTVMIAGGVYLGF